LFYFKLFYGVVSPLYTYILDNHKALDCD